MGNFMFCAVFDDMEDIFEDNILIAESKLLSSFPNSQLLIQGFHASCQIEELLAYVKNDLPSRHLSIF